MNNYVIETRNLTKQYETQKSVADLNIHVKKGRIYGLLGRNGAGKTTTMKMLLGLTEPTSGTVHIFGRNIQTDERTILPRIGSLIESPGFYPNLTGTENLRIFAELRGVPGRDSIRRSLELVGLPYRDKKLFSQYSLGMLADDIGIIDHGVLLEEESLEELEQRNGRYIHFRISDAAQAGRILETQFHTQNFSIKDDHNLMLYDLNLDAAFIIHAFDSNKVAVSEAHLCEETLEDYFKKVTGGEGIA